MDYCRVVNRTEIGGKSFNGGPTKDQPLWRDLTGNEGHIEHRWYKKILYTSPQKGGKKYPTIKNGTSFAFISILM